MNIDQYRNKILEILLKAQDSNGNNRLTEQEAQSLANEFSDQELMDGMDFNTPEEVADMLLESGL
ncbi:hypothetical protein PRBRB14_23470 [Hallella multisaccharivorax DSM 17128]|uniref:Uncharacterized protein n=1 Tax=Hallella multisaccharivorax DSM 17128 TaxID=688246 RepID=F8N6R1_9BACT|nr:hypothetical protein [Hallella multisaccharivorax]EGN57296.1 hypothetical protein Premu_1893 [Hallella multisaccharivorax DSM 17128]GJG31468.1 hypothetical protein PRBRB14_23470 [Hallella multisaccharivorax DSM 17128]